MYPLKVIVLAIAVSFVSCRPDGASPISCANMDPEHYNPVQARLSRGQLGPSPYKLTAAWDISKKMVRVSVRGDKIQGFLLQGRKDFSGPAIGSFINIAQNPNATYQHCEHYPEFGKDSSVTHSNREYQKQLEFYWMAPANFSNGDNVTFFATLARNKNIFWVAQKSNTLPLNMEDANDDDVYRKYATKISLRTSPGAGGSNEGNGLHGSQALNVLLTALLVLMFWKH